MTDRQTHRQTETDTAWRHRPRLCIASHGKNLSSGLRLTCRRGWGKNKYVNSNRDVIFHTSPRKLPLNRFLLNFIREHIPGRNYTNRLRGFDCVRGHISSFSIGMRGRCYDAVLQCSSWYKCSTFTHNVTKLCQFVDALLSWDRKRLLLSEPREFVSRVSTMTHDIDIAILPVCPSVRHVPLFYGNGSTYCHSLVSSPHGSPIRTDFARRAFRCSAPTVWNLLPETIISADSLSVFKSTLKTNFFHKAFE